MPELGSGSSRSCSTTSGSVVVYSHVYLYVDTRGIDSNGVGFSLLELFKMVDVTWSWPQGRIRALRSCTGPWHRINQTFFLFAEGPLVHPSYLGGGTKARGPSKPGHDSRSPCNRADIVCKLATLGGVCGQVRSAPVSVTRC